MGRDLPEYFPPAGEPPPAAPEMAAAALEMVIFFKKQNPQFVSKLGGGAKWSFTLAPFVQLI